MMFSILVSSRYISIHALREEGDVDGDSRAAQIFGFLSTPSARRATLEFCQRLWCFGISIHALREEGDFHLDVIRKSFFAFLSTPSARRATLQSSTNKTAISRFLSTPSARRATP